MEKETKGIICNTRGGSNSGRVKGTSHGIRDSLASEMEKRIHKKRELRLLSTVQYRGSVRLFALLVPSRSCNILFLLLYYLFRSSFLSLLVGSLLFFFSLRVSNSFSTFLFNIPSPWGISVPAIQNLSSQNSS